MRAFSYREAAILIGGRQSKLVNALDKITGGIMLGAATVVSDVLSWFDAKADFVKLSHDLVNLVFEQKRGLRRFDRTRRIEAAHTVIVMTAFFESFAGFDLPFTSREVTGADQRRLQDLASPGTGTHVGEWLHDDTLLPTPDRPFESNLRAVERRYEAMAGAMLKFIAGLSVWDEIAEPAREQVSAQLKMLPEKALGRYRDMFRTLVTQFPEVACWANMTDHAATRAEVRNLSVSLVGLAKMLADIEVGRSPDARRADLARAYRAALTEPVLPPGEASQQFAIPTVERAYVNPRFKVGPVQSDSRPSQESWWNGFPDRADIQQYLLAYLTSSRAASAPLVVLGQPGAGKSMLTKVLAARLPAADFLPIRVELRDVPVEADVQDQIEHAIRRATGDRVEWTDLARSAGDAIPVILLDGFDELLQATRAHHVDYLTKVSQFQKREADQGRPVTVIVTTRIAVAGLARFPGESVALRIEPFERDQVEQWVTTWNAENRGYFAETNLSPLTVDAVMAYPDLATQPLLLLMLALYDAEGNALRGQGRPTSKSDLYEQLLVQFARREVTKEHQGTDEELARAVEVELRRLSYVAFAMFNRGTQWVGQQELNKDLQALFGQNDPDVGRSLRRQLNAAEIAIGRFFFIHRATARQAETTLETYEFLHATFSEYLVARMTWTLVKRLAAQELVADDFFDRGAVDDSMLHALLSFEPLSGRTPIVRFLEEMSAQLPDRERKAAGNVLIRLFRKVHDERTDNRFRSYLPRSVPVPRRYAAYSANLVVLVVAVKQQVRVSQLYGEEERAVRRWLSDALLWRSQTDYYSMIDLLAVDRIWNGKLRDIDLTLKHAQGKASPVDLQWSYERQLVSGGMELISTFHRDGGILIRQHFFGSPSDDVLAHTMEPLARYMPGGATKFIEVKPGQFRSVANQVLELLLAPDTPDDAGKRAEIYNWLAQVYGPTLPRRRRIRDNFYEFLLRRLSVDSTVPSLTTAVILSYGRMNRMVSTDLVMRVVLKLLGEDPAADKLLGETVKDLMDRVGVLLKAEYLVEFRLRALEVGSSVADPPDEQEWRKLLGQLKAAGKRPDLVRRAEWMMAYHFGSGEGAR